MSESVFLCLLLSVCILQTVCAADSPFNIHSLRSDRSRLQDSMIDSKSYSARSAELRRAAAKRGEQYVIGRDSTVGGMLYEISQTSLSVYGLATLGQQLFVLPIFSDTIQVYDTSRPDHALVRNITLPGAGNNMAACSRQQTLYISGFFTKRLFRVDQDGHVTTWRLPHDPYGVSVDPATCYVTVTYPARRQFQLFTDDGKPHPLKSLKVDDPWKAIPVSDQRYIVSYGWDEGGVALVNGSGHVLQSDTIAADSGSGSLSRPFDLELSEAGFVIVADFNDHSNTNNRRVVLLDPSLRYIRELVSRDQHGIGKPHHIWLDEGRGLLYVADDHIGPTHDHESSVKVFSLQ